MKLLRVGVISSLLFTVVMSSSVEAFDFPNVTPDPDAPSYLFLPDGPITLLKRGETTGGRYALMESIVPPGGASPPHIHHQENEWIYIAEGNMEIVVGETFYSDATQIPGVNAPRDTLFAVDAPAGTLFYGEKKFIHGVRNTGDTTGKVLLVTDPAGFEGLLEVTQPVPDLSNLPPFDPATFGAVFAAAPDFGIVGSSSFEQFGDIVVDDSFQLPDGQADRLLSLLAKDIESVPEPSSLWGVLGFGILGAISVWKRKRQSHSKVV